jgi:hypothetical protein
MIPLLAADLSMRPMNLIISNISEIPVNDTHVFIAALLTFLSAQK